MNDHTPDSDYTSKIDGSTPPVSAKILEQFQEFGEEFLSEISAAFQEDIEKRLQELQEALARRDLRGVALAAHNIKGMSGNFGAWRLEGLGGRIESLATAGELDGILPLVPLLRDFIREVKAALSDALGAAAGGSKKLA